MDREQSEPLADKELAELEITELAEVIYNFQMDIPTIKINIENFLLANHYRIVPELKVLSDETLQELLINMKPDEFYPKLVAKAQLEDIKKQLNV